MTVFLATTCFAVLILRFLLGFDVGFSIGGALLMGFIAQWVLGQKKARKGKIPTDQQVLLMEYNYLANYFNVSLAEKLEDNLASDLGIEDLPPENREGVLEKAKEALLLEVLTEVLLKLSDQDIGELQRIQQERDVVKLEQFLQDKLGNYEEAFGKLLKKNKKEMREKLVQVKKKVVGSRYL